MHTHTTHTQQPRDPEEVLRMVLHRILQWLRDNYARTVDLFHMLDSNQDNHLSCEEFVTGMRMLEVRIVLPMQQFTSLPTHYQFHKKGVG